MCMWPHVCRCLTPPGVGSVVLVRVTVNRLAGLPVELWHYVAPVVTAVSPANLQPEGGTLLVLNGTNFGTWSSRSSVTVGTRQCAPVISWSHAGVVCVAPPGVVAQAPVSLAAGDQEAPLRAVAYLPPVVHDYFPREFATDGGLNLTLVGDRFATSPPLSVSAGLVGTRHGAPTSLACDVLLANATFIVCRVPEGAGAAWTVRVTNSDGLTGGNQQSPLLVDAVGTNLLLASYLPPSVTTLFHVLGAAPATGGFLVVINGMVSVCCLPNKVQGPCKCI
jgi:hypothetical protein